MCTQFDRPAESTHSCPRFRAKKNFAKTLGQKLTSIMRAAQGKLNDIDFKA